MVLTQTGSLMWGSYVKVCVAMWVLSVISTPMQYEIQDFREEQEQDVNVYSKRERD